MLENIVPSLLIATSDFSNDSISGVIGEDKMLHAGFGGGITACVVNAVRHINSKQRVPPIPPYLAGVLATFAMAFVWENFLDPQTPGYVHDVTDITGDYFAAMVGSILYCIGDCLVRKNKER